MRRAITATILLFVAYGFTPAHSQSEVTFKVNITHLTADSEFNPERDRVELIGNRHPLSATMPVELKQDENNKDLFIARVRFPSDMVNRQVEYQFRVQINNRYRNEDMPRTVRIPAADRALDTIYFNSYAW